MRRPTQHETHIVDGPRLRKPSICQEHSAYLAAQVIDSFTTEHPAISTHWQSARWLSVYGACKQPQRLQSDSHLTCTVLAVICAWPWGPSMCAVHACPSDTGFSLSSERSLQTNFPSASVHRCVPVHVPANLCTDLRISSCCHHEYLCI